MDDQEIIPLRLVKSTNVCARHDFAFRPSLWKPSHFYTGLEIHTETTTWRTFRIGEFRVGLRLRELHNHLISVDIYSDRKLPSAIEDYLIQRIIDAYGFEDDLTSFTHMVEASKYQAQMQRLKGMRISCPESIFEIAVVSLLLQNTTIQRTTQMLHSLLSDYGSVVRFDGISLRMFFNSTELSNIEESELRERNRIGYRAKYLPEFARFFGNWMEPEDRHHVPKPILAEELQSIKGIGPYSSNVIISSALRDPKAVPLDVWNVRLLSKVLFDEDCLDRDRVLSKLKRTFPDYEGLAALYFIEDSCLEHPLDPLQTSNSVARRNSVRRLA